MRREKRISYRYWQLIFGKMNVRDIAVNEIFALWWFVCFVFVPPLFVLLFCLFVFS